MTLPALATSPAVHLVACPHPFSFDRKELDIPAGATLLEMILAGGVRPGLLPYCHVWIGDHYVPRGNWAVVKPKAGTHVTVRAAPGGGGGGKNPLRTVLIIAVLAASFVAGAYFGPLIAEGLGITSQFGLQVVTGFVGAATPCCGPMLLALAPPCTGR